RAAASVQGGSAMSVMYLDSELTGLGYQASRMELTRATNDPSYDTPAEYVARVGQQAALQASTPGELGSVVATMRRWLSGRSQVVGMAEFAAAVSARPFEPELSSGGYHFV